MAGKTRKPPEKAHDAVTGAFLIRKYAIKIFDREDGEPADWLMIADALQTVALKLLDKAPQTPKLEAHIRRMEVYAYERLSKGLDVVLASSSDPEAFAPAGASAHHSARSLPKPRPPGASRS